MNSVLLEDFIIKNKGARIPRNPQLIFGDTNKYLRGDILDANAVVSEIASRVGDLVDTTPETLNTLRELAESLQETGGDINALVSRITDVETSVANLTQSQSTTIAELTSGLAADIAALQMGKVDAVSGKQLSTEDYITADKNKLAGIEAGALVNPTNVSAFTNDAGYLTAHQSLAGYATEAWVNDQGFLTQHQDISNKANIADLATVATSGSYNDLTNKPDFNSILNNAGFVTQADFDDAVGIDIEGLQELKAILSDDDTTTGLLNVLDQKVEKVTGKLLSTEDYTTAEKTKLAGIEEGAQVNPTNVSELTNDAGYLVEDDLMEEVVDANGHEYIDLGLPSGTLWATMNVGASSETDYGNYYQYGKGAALYAATSGQSDYSGTEDPLDSSVDTATQVWGGSWHMPTKTQFEELIANTTYEWTIINGVNGGKFTSQNGNYVFFAAAGNWNNGSQSFAGSAGYYWGSTLGDLNYPCYLGIGSGTGVYDRSRKYGCSVRGVLSSSKTPKYALATDADTINAKLTDISGQFTNTYSPRAVAEGQTSLISDATNIQDALNKLDDSIVTLNDLLKWIEYEAIIPVAFYRVSNFASTSDYSGLVNSDGEIVIVTDGTSSKQFIFSDTSGQWIVADAEETELPQSLRNAYGTQTYSGATIGEDHIEFEIDGTSFVYNDGTLTPSVTEWAIVEIWADEQCTVKPTGTTDHVFAQVKKTFGMNDGRQWGNYGDQLNIATPSTESPQNGYSIQWYIDFANSAITGPITPGVYRLENSLESVDVTGYVTKFA